MSIPAQSRPTESGNAFTIVNVSRRRFLQHASAGALVLAVGLPSCAVPEEKKKYGADAMPHGTVDDPRVFVAIGDDGAVTITCHRAEMGQGVRTGIPMVVADELEADWTRVKVVQAWGDETRFGNQDTDGSRSLRHFFEPMRRCGAAARTMLETAAAAKWNVSAATVRATNHTVVHTPTGRTLGFGELARTAAELPVPDRRTLRLKDPAQFRYIGKPLGPVDGFDMSTGRARYGIDATLPGMRFAVIARPPVYGGKVASFDATETMKIAGVERVLEIPGTPPPSGFDPVGGVAVIARNTWLAIQGRNALKIEWDDGPNASYSSDAYKAQMQASARQPGQVVRSEGDVTSALARATKRIDAEYFHPGAGTPAQDSLPTPQGATAADVALGNRVYHGQVANAPCAGCHGDNAEGTPLGPDLTSSKWIWGDGSLSSIEHIITDGVAEPKNYRSPMPPMGGAQLSPPQVDAVAAYIWALSHRNGK